MERNLGKRKHLDIKQQLIELYCIKAEILKILAMNENKTRKILKTKGKQ